MSITRFVEKSICICLPLFLRAKQQYGKDAYEQLQYPSLTQSRYYVGEAVATT